MVCDILSYKHNAMSRHVETIRTRLQKFDIKQTRPDPTDHKLHLNPYMSLYGDIWREEIVKTTALKPYVCITDLVKHMYQESERVMKGTKYEYTWYIYHDALSLMTATSCRDWMKKEGILEQWLLPIMGLNDNTRYKHAPTGNSPEMMPLDCSLFQDPHRSVQRHIIYTSDLPRDDPKNYPRYYCSCKK